MRYLILPRYSMDKAIVAKDNLYAPGLSQKPLKGVAGTLYL